MGAGKTTIGRFLAKELNLDFFDSDREIESRAGADISWIFDVEGEAGFRTRETALIRQLSEQDNIVLSTGGGAVLKKSNQEVLISKGVVIYLETSVEQQLERTFKDTKRPLLQTENPREILDNLMVKRHPIYTKLADFMVKTDNRHPKAVTGEIIQLLQTENLLDR